MSKDFGVIQQVNQQTNLFSVNLEDGTYSVCSLRESANLEIGEVLFGSFKSYGMNYLETECEGVHLLVDVISIYVSAETANYIVKTL